MGRFFRAKFDLPAFRETDAHSAHTASLRQLKLGQVSHLSQALDVH